MQTLADGQLWVYKEEDGYRIGLTVAAQETLGNITFVSLPEIGADLAQGDAFSEVEAEKAVVEFQSPFTGKVAAINQAALNDPNLLNSEEPEENWLLLFEDVAEKNLIQ